MIISIKESTGQRDCIGALLCIATLPSKWPPDIHGRNILVVLNSILRFGPDLGSIFDEADREDDE